MGRRKKTPITDLMPTDLLAGGKPFESLVLRNEMVNPRERIPVYVQDNSLIESCYSMSVIAKRVIALAISKISPMEMPDKQPRIVEINANDWRKVFKDASPWRALKEACDELLNCHVVVPISNESELKVQWVEAIEYFEDGGTVFVRFTDPIFYRLTGLRERFTAIDLNSSGELQSFYSIRIFELCCRFKSTGFLSIKYDDLRRIMECENAYERTSDFIKNVIKLSIDEINKKTLMNLAVKTVKVGRNVDRFDFTFSFSNEVIFNG